MATVDYTCFGVTVGRYVLLECKLCGPVAVTTGPILDAATTHIADTHTPQPEQEPA